MVAPLYKLHCLLKRAQMLLLCLGIAYLMAGSILLLQRSSIRVAQPNPAGLPPIMSLSAPPTALRTAGLGVRARSRWAAIQSVSGGGAKAGRHWPTSRSLGVQHLHRRWFHTFVSYETPFAVHLKRTYIGCFLHNASDRALGGTMLYDLRKMTSSLCQDTCSESGYQFAGLEYGAECHCGNRISSPRAPEEDCSLVCRGERGSPCGGVGRLSIYKVEEQLPGHRKFRNVHYRGCFKLPAVIYVTYDSLIPCIHPCILGSRSLDFLVILIFCSSTTETDNKSSVPPDSRCKERMFLPQRSSSLVALSSFPGAGNTWVRHLIELATGYYTGSFYFDGTLYNRGFKGEKDYWKSGRSICVKTHESGQKEIEMFDSAILLIRNPYRSLMAEFNRKCAGHLGHATDTQWKSKEWPEFVSSYAPWWASHAMSWLKFGRRLLVVHYEELQRALLPQLRLITGFLNVTMTEERLLCAQSNQDGHFKRSVAQRPSFDPFTQDMKRMIDSFIHTVDQALQSRNFSGLPQEYLPR
uniref:WSC domain containing 1b n=1 Tax=Echeneis naucrates TaxID=173247 RepID=A0A665TCP2_ECHNA